VIAFHEFSRFNSVRNSLYERIERTRPPCGLVSEFLATDPEAGVRFPALPEKKSSGSGTGSTQPLEYNGGAT
jgi:hypothetical protein